MNELRLSQWSERCTSDECLWDNCNGCPYFKIGPFFRLEENQNGVLVTIAESETKETILDIIECYLKGEL